MQSQFFENANAGDPQRVLITGGSGFLGRHVIAQGAQHKLELHAVSRSHTAIPGVRSWAADVTDSERMLHVIREVRPTVIIHLAAAGVAYGGDGPADLLNTNACAFARMLESVLALDLTPSVVVAGSGFEYGRSARPIKETDPLVPYRAYGVSKAAASLLAELYADRLPVTVLRFFSLYGPGEREPRLAPFIIAQAMRGQRIALTEGEQVRDYTYVEDAAEACWRAIASCTRRPSFRLMNVGPGSYITLKEFARAIGDALECRGIIAPMDFGARPYRTDELMSYCADVTHLTDTLGWRPSTPLHEGIRRMVEAAL